VRFLAGQFEDAGRLREQGIEPNAGLLVGQVLSRPVPGEGKNRVQFEAQFESYLRPDLVRSVGKG